MLLRWGVQNGYPVIPKTTKAERMRENAEIFTSTIDDSDMAELRSLGTGADGYPW